MTSLAPAFAAALEADRALVTLLIEVSLPDYALRLLAGPGAVAWGSKLFVGEDANFGVLSSIEAVEDGDDDQAPSLTFSVYPPDEIAAAQLCAASYQNAPISLWLAGIYPTTGQVIADPDLLFVGFLDQQTLKVGKGTREVDFQCVSQFDLLLEDDEGARLSDAFHTSIWPGETGCANVTGLTEQRYWGLATPRTGSVVQADATDYGDIA